MHPVVGLDADDGIQLNSLGLDAVGEPLHAQGVVLLVPQHPVEGDHPQRWYQ